MVRFVVGAPAVAVHLHEVGLGLLVDLRPTDPSLATLAVDGQALLLHEEAPTQFLTDPLLLEGEGVMAMVIHSLLLKSPPPLLGKGRDGGHGHIGPSSQTLSSSAGKWKGWSWSYTSFLCKASPLFWEREGTVVRVVVGALAVVVHLHEVGLGHLADLRPTAPSLATLAVDRQALLLDKEASNKVLTSPPLSGM